MLFDQTRPCSQCPFRVNALAGWLGDSSPEEFIDTCLADHLMPCHKTVDYDDEDWKEKMLDETSEVQHCAGARIFFANQCKMPKHGLYLLALRSDQVKKVKPSNDVFANRQRFLDHHNTPFHSKKK